VIAFKNTSDSLKNQGGINTKKKCMKINSSFGGIYTIHTSFTVTVHFASSNTAASRTITRLPKTTYLNEITPTSTLLPSSNKCSVSNDFWMMIIEKLDFEK
jgi:hypothetical protein